MSFRKELETLINSYSMENESNTPDFLLADFLEGALITFDQVVKRRDEWYGQQKQSKETVKAKPGFEPVGGIGI